MQYERHAGGLMGFWTIQRPSAYLGKRERHCIGGGYMQQVVENNGEFVIPQNFD